MNIISEQLIKLLDEKSSITLERWNDDWIIILSIQDGKRQLHVKGEDLEKELDYIQKWKEAIHEST